MSIAVRCPDNNCRRLVRVDSSLRGKRIHCPACGAGLRIPAATAPEPVPIDLDDTPPDLEAITESEQEKKTATGPSQASQTAERVADGAAAATSAIGPLLKLLAALVFLAGLVFLSVKIIFPALWPDEPIATATSGELTREEEEKKRREQERLALERPLAKQTSDRIREAINAGKLATAREQLDALKDDSTVAAADRAALEFDYLAARGTWIEGVYRKSEELVAADRWDDARAELDALTDLDPGIARGGKFETQKRLIDADEAVDRMERSKLAAGRKDFDEAKRLSEEARQLNKLNRDVQAWWSELPEIMQCGIRFDTEGVVADVYLDGKKLGDTARSVWQLPPNMRIWPRLQAPGRVPREVRSSLSPRQHKVVKVHLVPAVPDALWIAGLLRTSPAKWVACRATGGDDPVTRRYTRTLESRCTSAKPKPKKRNVWQVRLRSGSTHNALEYTELGDTVRFIDLDDGKTVKTTTDQIAAKKQLDIDTGAERWLAAVRRNARQANDACKVLLAVADFVEVFPDKIDLVLETCRPEVDAAVAVLAAAVACSDLGRDVTRETMDIGKRLEAEERAWKNAGSDAPADLLEQKRDKRR